MKKFYSFIAAAAAAIAMQAGTGESWYFPGAWCNWDLNAAPFVEDANNPGVYTYNMPQLLKGEFKVASAGWAEEYGTNGSKLVLGEPYSMAKVGSGNNIGLAVDAVANAVVTLDTNASPYTLLITGDPVEMQEFTVSVAGDFNGWNTNANKVEINTAVDGDVAKIVVPNFQNASGSFKIVLDGSSWLGNGVICVLDWEYYVANDGQNMRIPQECEGHDVTFAYNVRTKMLSVSSDVNPSYNVAIAGAFNGWKTETNNANTVDGKATIVVPEYINAVDGMGEGFKVVVGYYWMTANNNITNGTPIYCGSADGENMQLDASAEGKEVTFVFDMETRQLVASWEVSGIDALENDNATPVYYNLQGVRVDNPNAGVYIVVRGNKATKQYIK